MPAQWGGALQFSYEYSNINFSLGAWHYIDINFVRDAVAGGVAYYVDGTKISERLTTDTSGVFLDRLLFGDPIGGDVIPNGEYLHFDDLIGTSTQRGPYVPLPTEGGIYQKPNAVRLGLGI